MSALCLGAVDREVIGAGYGRGPWVEALECRQAFLLAAIWRQFDSRPAYLICIQIYLLSTKDISSKSVHDHSAVHSTPDTLHLRPFSAAGVEMLAVGLPGALN